MPQNRFLVLEGIDGSGKTTLAKLLVTQLSARNINATYTNGIFSPYEAARGDIHRNANPQASYFFYLSAVCFASSQIAKMLESQWVICDRYIYTTDAYHRARDVATLVPYTSLGIQMPDRAFHITVADPNIAAARIRARSQSLGDDQDDVRHPEFVARVNSAYSLMGLLDIDNSGDTPTNAIDRILDVLVDLL